VLEDDRDADADEKQAAEISARLPTMAPRTRPSMTPT
jgi:hypothetical protein